MNSPKQNLLRRTLALAGVLSGVAFAIPAAAQTVTLSSGASCVYTAMTVNPNGSVSVTCQVQGNETTATFGVSGPTSMLIASTGNVATVTRSGGPAEPLTINYQIAGAGCTNAWGTLTFAQGAPSQTIPLTPTAEGVCNIGIAAPTGHTAQPNFVSIAVSATQQQEPPPPPGCPAIPLGSLAKTLTFGYVDQLRMTSGQVAYYPVIASQYPKSSIVFTQGQQPNTPAGVVTEFSVSKCPGYMDKHEASQCYRTSPYANNNAITIYTKAITAYGWDSQAKIGSRGCWAPEGSQPYYVNVRWTYPSACPYTTGCGFSMQWANGPY